MAEYNGLSLLNHLYPLVLQATDYPFFPPVCVLCVQEFLDQHCSWLQLSIRKGARKRQLLSVRNQRTGNSWLSLVWTGVWIRWPPEVFARFMRSIILKLAYSEIYIFYDFWNGKGTMWEAHTIAWYERSISFQLVYRYWNTVLLNKKSLKTFTVDNSNMIYFFLLHFFQNKVHVITGSSFPLPYLTEQFSLFCFRIGINRPWIMRILSGFYAFTFLLISRMNWNESGLIDFGESSPMCSCFLQTWNFKALVESGSQVWLDFFREMDYEFEGYIPETSCLPRVDTLEARKKNKIPWKTCGRDLVPWTL